MGSPWKPRQLGRCEASNTRYRHATYIVEAIADECEGRFAFAVCGKKEARGQMVRSCGFNGL